MPSFPVLIYYGYQRWIIILNSAERLELTVNFDIPTVLFRNMGYWFTLWNTRISNRAGSKMSIELVLEIALYEKQIRLYNLNNTAI